MGRVSPILFFLFYCGLATAQSNSGFIKGNKELTRFLEKKLVNKPIDDTASYIFTTAALVFDGNGAIDTVKFMNDNDLKLRTYLTK